MSVGARAVRFIRAKFDSAQTTPDNRRHWANADYLAADAAASPDVRRTLRSRARYEVANNSYARGIVLTLANDVTGTGPRLQMLTDNPQANREIEREFGKWAKAVGLAERLRTMRMARAQDGEAFAMLVSNGSLASAVTLDLRLIEADQVTTPNLSLAAKANAVDGIVFDASGNPVEYHVLKAHP
ncbi:MAG: phage portal protein, partial [Acidobacteria bacterium]|nr:phage portal protein [Acidobacteriota bacterium]